MSGSVRWRPAVKNRDTVALRSFTCARAWKGAKRPPIYEDEVQRYLRQHAVAATNRSRDQGRDGRLILAEDSRGIAAAYTHQRFDEPQRHPNLDIPDDLPQREICFLGVGLWRRGTGFADTVVAHALWDVLDRSPEAPLVYIWCRVDHRNEPSQKMLTRAHFTEVTHGGPGAQPDARLGWWLRMMPRS